MGVGDVGVMRGGLFGVFLFVVVRVGKVLVSLGRSEGLGVRMNVGIGVGE